MRISDWSSDVCSSDLWIQLPSNCVIPLHVAELAAATPDVVSGLCGGVGGTLGLKKAFDPLLNKNYDPADYPELNGGAGLRADLSGNELDRKSTRLNSSH